MALPLLSSLHIVVQAFGQKVAYTAILPEKWLAQKVAKSRTFMQY